MQQAASAESDRRIRHLWFVLAFELPALRRQALNQTAESDTSSPGAPLWGFFRAASAESDRRIRHLNPCHDILGLLAAASAESDRRIRHNHVTMKAIVSPSLTLKEAAGGNTR